MVGIQVAAGSGDQTSTGKKGNQDSGRGRGPPRVTHKQMAKVRLSPGPWTPKLYPFWGPSCSQCSSCWEGLDVEKERGP